MVLKKYRDSASLETFDILTAFGNTASFVFFIFVHAEKILQY